MKSKRLILTWWPSALTLGVILYGVLWPDPLGDDSPGLFPGADLLIHAIMMGGLVGAVAFDYQRSQRNNPELLRPGLMCAIALAVTAFGGALEIVQTLMGLGREADFTDFIADTVGAFAAVVLAPPAIKRVLSVKK